MSANQLPPEVVELLAHLKQTGTGKAKLEALRQVALESANGDQFLARAAKVVPDGTWRKLQRYLLADNKLSPDPNPTVTPVVDNKTPTVLPDPVPCPTPAPVDPPKESPAVEKTEGNRHKRR